MEAVVVRRASRRSSALSNLSADQDHLRSAQSASAVSLADERPIKDDEETIGCGPIRIPRHVYYTVLLMAINIILFADTNLLAPVLTPIAREFGFVERYDNGTVIIEYDDRLDRYVEKVDAQERDTRLGGDITLAFFVIGGTVSLIVGYLADSVNRRNTLAAVVVLGETSCLATFWVTHGENGYYGLLLTRALTGIAIGGAIPLVYSLFGDLFSTKHRGKAIAAAGMAVGAGTGLGQTIAGPIAGEDGSNWRYSFVVVAIPAYFLAALLLLTVKEPPRGRMEEAFQEMQHNGDGKLQVEGEPIYEGKITWSAVRNLLRTRTVLLVLLQGIPGSLPWGIFGGFLSDFLAEEKNIDLRLTGTVLLIFGVGNVIGNIVSGLMIDYMFGRAHLRHHIPWILGILTGLGAIPMAIYVMIPPLGFGLTALFVIPAGFLLGVASNATKVFMVNVTTPETRGTAFSLLNLSDDLGKGAGVFVLARFFTLFEDTAGSTARAKGMAAGFLIGWPLCGILIGLISFSLTRDYEAAQAAVRHNLGIDDPVPERSESSADSAGEGAVVEPMDGEREPSARDADEYTAADLEGGAEGKPRLTL